MNLLDFIIYGITGGALGALWALWPRSRKHVETVNGTHRRCDYRCIMALEKVCVCACNGKNHGIGLKLLED